MQRDALLIVNMDILTLSLFTYIKTKSDALSVYLIKFIALTEIRLEY